MSSKQKKKTLERESEEKRDGAEVLIHPTQRETIYERNTTFRLGPGVGAGFDHPFFQRPMPFTIKTFSPATKQPNEGNGAGEVPPNVSHGTGPMGAVFCQAEYKFNAPRLQGMTNYINAENVMIGNGNKMNIDFNGVFDQGTDTDTDESSSAEEEQEGLQEEIERKRKDQEKYEKKARLQETLRSSRPISDKEMRDVSKRLLGAWKKFLRYLDIEDEVLDQYYQDYAGNGGLSEVVYQSLDYWRRNTESPEVQKVANALGRVNMYDTVSDCLHP